MDDVALETYMRELTNQAEAARIAALDYDNALQARAQGVPRAFAAMQSLLASAAMISKLLWPKPAKLTFDGSPLTGEKEKVRVATVERGKRLRSELGIRGIPVLESRKVRNAFEHFDERLDEFFATAPRFVLDRNIGPKDRLVHIEGEASPVHLRLIDPEAGTVSVLGEAVVIQELFDAISDVGSRAEKWMQDAARYC